MKARVSRFGKSRLSARLIKPFIRVDGFATLALFATYQKTGSWISAKPTVQIFFDPLVRDWACGCTGDLSHGWIFSAWKHAQQMLPLHAALQVRTVAHNVARMQLRTALVVEVAVNETRGLSIPRPLDNESHDAPRGSRGD